MTFYNLENIYIIFKFNYEYKIVTCYLIVYKKVMTFYNLENIYIIFKFNYVYLHKNLKINNRSVKHIYIQTL